MEKITSKYSVLDVANYLKFLGVNTNLRFNKLLYFLQAHFLVTQDGKVALFYEEIEAWPYGPVVREVFNAFNNKKIICEDSNEISGEDKKIIKEIYNYFTDTSDMSLVNLTHEYDSWKKAWQIENEKNMPFLKNEVISKEEIYKYHIFKGF